jgi:hypothetical protein
VAVKQPLAHNHFFLHVSRKSMDSKELRWGDWHDFWQNPVNKWFRGKFLKISDLADTCEIGSFAEDWRLEHVRMLPV